MAISNVVKLITLDIYNHDTTPETIKAIAADNDTRYVAAEIQNEGVWYDIGSDSDVELIIIRSDKVGVAITGQPYPIEYETGGEIDPETGDETPVVTETYYGVYAELDQPALAKAGTLLGQFKITNGNQILRTEIFKINNGRALDTETDEWAGEYQGYNLEELVTDVNGMKTKMSAVENDMQALQEQGTIEVLFVQGGYSRRGTKLGSGTAVYYLIMADYVPDDIANYKALDGYKITLLAWNADDTWYGFLVDDYTFTNVSTDPSYWTDELQLNRYREMYPDLKLKIEMANNATAGGVNTRIYPSEAINGIAHFNNTGLIESYYADELDATVTSVRNALTEPALVFPLVTDIHYQSVNSSFNNFIKNVKAFAQKVKCDFVLNLGDNTDGNRTQEVTLARDYYMLERFMEIGAPYYHAIGNHDTNYYQSATIFNSDQIYSAYLSNTRGVHYNLTAGEKDFYKDFDELGIRLIVLDGNHNQAYGFSANTATWLTNTALSTNYIVVIGVHFSPIASQNWSARSMSNATAVAAAIQTFVNNGGTVIQLCGHSHADYHFDTPWLSIHSNCQKFIQEDPTDSGYADIASAVNDLEFPARTAGTATEDCWSVVIIKPVSRKIDLIRFGAGNDREFSF